MILTVDMLSKKLKKQRSTAVSLLNQLTSAGKLPELIYDYEHGGTPKRPSHFAKVRFRVPRFLLEGPLSPNMDNITLFSTSVSGSGRCSKKVSAKSLAALEVILRLEEEMEVPNGYLLEKLEQYIAEQNKLQAEIEAVPVTQEIPGVSFANIPYDMTFKEISEFKNIPLILCLEYHHRNGRYHQRTFYSLILKIYRIIIVLRDLDWLM